MLRLQSIEAGNDRMKVVLVGTGGEVTAAETVLQTERKWQLDRYMGFNADLTVSIAPLSRYVSVGTTDGTGRTLGLEEKEAKRFGYSLDSMLRQFQDDGRVVVNNPFVQLDWEVRNSDRVGYITGLITLKMQDDPKLKITSLMKRDLLYRYAKKVQDDPSMPEVEVQWEGDKALIAVTDEVLNTNQMSIEQQIRMAATQAASRLNVAYLGGPAMGGRP